MSLNVPENDPFLKKQPIRVRKKRLQESSRLRQKNFRQELEALPLLKGFLIHFFRINKHAEICFLLKKRGASNKNNCSLKNFDNVASFSISPIASVI